jgi:TRAP transporter TAXI family solute receptor
MRSVILAFLLAVATALSPRHAAVAQPWQVDPAAAARANAGTVTIIAGGIDGTYIRIASDLAAVLDDGTTLRILPVLGKGSLQNIADILYLRGVDVGIVQSDVLAYVRQRHLYPNIEQSVQYIAKLYDEEVHVLVRKDIARIEDLADQPVNVDLSGSGTAMTASLMFEQLGIKPQMTNLDQPTALEKLKSGELAGVVFVSGQPVRLFSNIAPESGLHFVTVPLTDQLAQTYLPAELNHASYPALINEGASVPTIAVGSVMAVFAFPPGHERYGKIARFVDAFFSKFPELLKPPRHPKWKDVNLAARVPGWKQFGPAQDALGRQLATGQASGNLKTELAAFLARSGAGAHPTDQQLGALVRQFLKEQAQPPAAR